MAKETIIVGMSGGIDSSVTAWLLKEQGYHVVGLFMKNWEDDDNEGYCSAKQDLLDVISVADKLNIDIDVVNFSHEYKERVFSIFLSEYSAGRTPNPDILCNSEIKFSAFLDKAMEMGGDKIATGHYARLMTQDSAPKLLKGSDPNKDQSYFLHRLTQAQLDRAMFPVGDMVKTDLRALAREIGLHNAGKKDSTGICFIGERPFREFLSRYIQGEPGPMVTPDGKRVGTHEGLPYYTIGQRKGIGIGGSREGDGRPWFVAGKDLEKNALIVVQGHDHPALLGSELIMDNVHWISGQAPDPKRHYAAKIRYRSPDAPCKLEFLDDNRSKLIFDKPQWAIAPGQSAVIYDGDVCLGGGVIA